MPWSVDVADAVAGCGGPCRNDLQQIFLCCSVRYGDDIRGRRSPRRYLSIIGRGSTINSVVSNKTKRVVVSFRKRKKKYKRKTSSWSVRPAVRPSVCSSGSQSAGWPVGSSVPLSDTTCLRLRNDDARSQCTEAEKPLTSDGRLININNNNIYDDDSDRTENVQYPP